MAYWGADDTKPHIAAQTLIYLLDDDQDGAIDAAALAEVQAGVDAQIDAALMTAGYVTPVAVPGAFLASLGGRLAIAPLYARRENSTAPEIAMKIWEAAQADLRRIAEGKLTVPEGELEASSGAAGAIAVSADDDRGWSTSELF